MTDQPQVSVWHVVEAVAVVLVLGMFLFQAQSILNPVLLFALLWAVMIPFRGRPGHSALLSIAGVLTLIWLLASTRCRVFSSLAGRNKRVPFLVC